MYPLTVYGCALLTKYRTRASSLGCRISDGKIGSQKSCQEVVSGTPARDMPSKRTGNLKPHSWIFRPIFTKTFRRNGFGPDKKSVAIADRKSWQYLAGRITIRCFDLLQYLQQSYRCHFFTLPNHPITASGSDTETLWVISERHP